MCVRAHEGVQWQSEDNFSFLLNLGSWDLSGCQTLTASAFTFWVFLLAWELVILLKFVHLNIHSCSMFHSQCSTKAILITDNPALPGCIQNTDRLNQYFFLLGFWNWYWKTCFLKMAKLLQSLALQHCEGAHCIQLSQKGLPHTPLH